MRYVGRVPAPPLDRFIDDIYCLTGVPRYRRMNVPPMPSAHLFINLGGPVRLWDSDPSVPSAVFTGGFFMGVWTRRFLFEYPSPVRLVGVHFKPWGISPFVELPATELRNRWVPAANAVWQRSLDKIRDQVGDSASVTEVLRVLEAELRSRLDAAPARGLDLVERAGGRLLASHGAVSVSSLTDAAGVSGNHLATQFKSHVGVTPKRVARIYRFARLILSVDAQRPVDWPDLAQQRATSTRPTSARSSRTSPATPRLSTWRCGAGSRPSGSSRRTVVRCPPIDFLQASRPAQGGMIRDRIR